MFRQRYMIVEYSKETEAEYNKNPRDEKGQFQNWIHIHPLLGSYHWSRLDDNHIILTGNFPINHQSKLESDAKISLLPHVASSKQIKTKVKKPEHWAALKTFLGIAEESVMDDMLESIEAKCGAVFGPIR